ncbi:MAG: HTTM domain-containing protein [Myxococcota bacterium]
MSKRKKRRRSAKASAPESAVSPTPAKREAPPLNEAHGVLARFVFGPVSTARTFLLLRGTLLLLAFDCWIDLVPHGGRYGIGGFNVAHFSVLDALLPTPTAGTYVGSLIFTGLLAFAMAFRPWRPGLALLCASYTYGWAMSMLDSYQHHYLISLLLFSFVFFPLTSAQRLSALKDEHSTASRVGGAFFLWGSYEVLAGLVDLPTPLRALFTDDTLLGGARASMLLFGFIGPLLLRREREAGAPSEDRVLRPAWGYVSITVTCAIVYFYTAVTKLSPDWRNGDALSRIGRSEAFDALKARALEGMGPFDAVDAATFWSVMAKGAIAVQLVSAAAFLLASTQDRKGRSWLAALALAPLSFHVGAETMGLSIGWFSYYMLAVVVVLFAPRSAIEAAAAAIAPAMAKASDALAKALTGPRQYVALAVGALITAVLMMEVDLPGALGAAFYIGAVLFFVGVFAHRRRTQRGPLGVAFGAAAIFAFISLTATSVRYDYYRFVGGDHRRRGEYAEALNAYEKANRYLVTPYCVYEGESRKLECYREESTAEREAARRGTGHFVRRNDRERQAQEMRDRVARDGA